MLRLRKRRLERHPGRRVGVSLFGFFRPNPVAKPAESIRKVPPCGSSADEERLFGTEAEVGLYAFLFFENGCSGARQP